MPSLKDMSIGTLCMLCSCAIKVYIYELHAFNYVLMYFILIHAWEQDEVVQTESFTEANWETYVYSQITGLEFLTGLFDIPFPQALYSS